MFREEAKAITILSKKIWQSSEYFTFVQLSNRQEFLNSQVPFYYAVEAFPLLLLKLASQIVDEEARYLVVENIWQEHGQGDPTKYHTSTFKQHLKALGHEGKMFKNPFITSWLERLFELNSLEEQFHHLAAIEYMYAVISETIAAKLQASTLLCEQEHYTLHCVLDWSHGEDLLTSMDRCNIPFDQQVFKQAQNEFIQLFTQMASITESSLATIQQSLPVRFYYSRESPNVIDEVIESICRPDLKVLCVCSGGENPIHYLSKPSVSNVSAFDMNSAQLSVCRNKIMGQVNDVANGRFEYLFSCVRQYFIFQDRNNIVEYFSRNPELLDYAIEQIFNDHVLTALFGQEATKYSEKKFTDHFKQVYRKMMVEVMSRKEIHQNTKNVLFGEPIVAARQAASRIQTDLTLIHDCAYSAVNGNSFDIIDLSNIGDWMQYEQFLELLKLAYQQLNIGGRLILRRLLGDYCLQELPFAEVISLDDETGFYLETVLVKK